MNRTRTYESVGAQTLIGLLLAASALMCLLPILNLFAVSLSDKAATTANAVTFWPVGFNLKSYELILDNAAFLHAFGISALRVVTGAALSMLLIVLSAYPLAQEKEALRGRVFFVWYFVFTILFGGGLVPLYIVVNKLHLIDSFWALILPTAVPAFSVIILMNFFRGLPGGLSEAAVIDGAGHWSILFRIFLPLSLPALATLSLFAIIYHWNDWFAGLYLLSDNKKWPLQTYLYAQLYVGIDYSKLGPEEAKLIGSISSRSLRAAQIMVTMIPILLVYPFIQKFFVAGLTIGSVKE